MPSTQSCVNTRSKFLSRSATYACARAILCSKPPQPLSTAKKAEGRKKRGEGRRQRTEDRGQSYLALLFGKRTLSDSVFNSRNNLRVSWVLTRPASLGWTK